MALDLGKFRHTPLVARFRKRIASTPYSSGFPGSNIPTLSILFRRECPLCGDMNDKTKTMFKSQHFSTL